MADIQFDQQNGHMKKIHSEIDEDGTITEYQEHVVEEREDDSIKDLESADVVIILDNPDKKVYEQHRDLPDGRKLTLTTTITRNEDGTKSLERVTEILETTQVEVEEEPLYEEIRDKEEQVYENSKQDVRVTEEVQVYEDSQQEVSIINEELIYENVESTSSCEDPSEERVEINEDPVEAIDKHRQTDTAASGGADSPPGRRTMRHISYEEFTEQYTEYRPPKRYEKKQVDRAADKAAPKITIMQEGDSVHTAATDLPPGLPGQVEDVQGLPSGECYSGMDRLGSGSSNGQADVNMGDEIYANQPTRTQGSVIRRMDQGASNVDPATLVRAEDKPDMEAELPARGMSHSLRKKFQSMDSSTGQPIEVDYSKPTKTERQRNSGVYGYGMTSPPPAPSNMTTVDGVVYHEPVFEGGEVENEPEYRDDVVRETDRYDEQELPEVGYAGSILSRFKQLEKESAETKKYEYKPSGVGSKPTVTPLRPSSCIDPASQDTPQPEPEGGEYENRPIVRSDVVKESDPLSVEEELPTVGLTRNLLSSFKQKEAESKRVPVYKPSGAGNRPPRVTSQRSSSASTPEPHIEPKFEDGMLENVPVVRSDVIRESDRNDEMELPEAGYTSSLRARFTELESRRHSDYVEHRPSGVASKATPTPLGTANRHSIHSSHTSLSTDDETDGRVEPQIESGEFENQPLRRTDVIREEDRLDEEELPEEGIAKNLLSQFKDLESQRAENYQPSGVSSKPTPTPLWPPPCDDIITEETELPPPDSGEYENSPVTRADVIRESDDLYFNDLPVEGVTHKQSTHYQSLHDNQPADYIPSGVSQKATPSKLHIMAGRSSYYAKGTSPDLLPVNGDMEEQVVEAGEFENVPVVRDDVVSERAGSSEIELPEQGVTRNLLTRFSSLQEQNGSVAQHKPSGVASKPTPTPLRPSSVIVPDTPDTGSEASSEPREIVEHVEYENEPEINHNVIRSTDYNQHDYTPTAGAAKSLMDKFRQLETKKPERVEHRPSKAAGMSTPTPLTLKR